MVIYLTVDGGTTNTRVTLIKNGVIADRLKLGTGAKAGKAALSEALRGGIALILERNKLSEGEVRKILASGMITSEMGLCPLPHLAAPCGIDELAYGLYECKIDEVSKIPFVFARGVRVGGSDPATTDMMRGEETELMGISDKLCPDCAYILPGTHFKVIFTDSLGRISSFETTLSGELLGAVAESTILNASLTLKDQEANEKHLCLGAECARSHGLTAALFKVRVLDKVLCGSAEDCYSFALGAILSEVVTAVERSSAVSAVIGGRRELKEPLALLLKKYSSAKVTEADDEAAENAAAYGIVRIYERALRK